jgi:hypothetical protein
MRPLVCSKTGNKRANAAGMIEIERALKASHAGMIRIGFKGYHLSSHAVSTPVSISN